MIIEVKNLSKSFGHIKAVDGLGFSVPKGSFFAFLGQNGAGKTTTINMLTGLLQKDSGEIRYDGGKDFAAFKNQIGTVYQGNILDELLTVKENLMLYGSFYLSGGALKERFAQIVSLLSLGDFVNQRAKTLSGGQRRKAEIARALWNNPQILFLDEPTTGLDPKTRAELWNMLHGIRQENGTTLFLTTHYMEEAADADEVVIIHKGRLTAQGSPVQLKSEYSADRLLITPENAETLEKTLAVKKLDFKKTAGTYTVKATDARRSIELLNEIKQNVRFFELLKGSMDDVFLNVTGEKISE